MSLHHQLSTTCYTLLLVKGSMTSAIQLLWKLHTILIINSTVAMTCYDITTPYMV